MKKRASGGILVGETILAIPLDDRSLIFVYDCCCLQFYFGSEAIVIHYCVDFAAQHNTEQIEKTMAGVFILV
jgi:hypothetical protein